MTVDDGVALQAEAVVTDLAEVLGSAGPAVRRARRSRRRRGAAVHGRDDRRPEGRDAHARQPRRRPAPDRRALPGVRPRRGAPVRRRADDARQRPRAGGAPVREPGGRAARRAALRGRRGGGARRRAAPDVLPDRPDDGDDAAAPEWAGPVSCGPLVVREGHHRRGRAARAGPPGPLRGAHRTSRPAVLRRHGDDRDRDADAVGRRVARELGVADAGHDGRDPQPRGPRRSSCRPASAARSPSAARRSPRATGTARRRPPSSSPAARSARATSGSSTTTASSTSSTA